MFIILDESLINYFFQSILFLVMSHVTNNIVYYTYV